ncbi:MAG: 1-acyl-sn-glycerol-3-phosphate acyltransferase [Candidatus Sericytochromatia bacterium]|nr:1-acyl-sn-glycerol-3-phosphate acyltransferase [Candidatus Tanganyikabacteria bacterium]
MSLTYAAARALLKPLVDRQIHIRAEGADNVPREGPALVVCNHRSVVDPFVLGSVLERPVHFVAAPWMGAVPGLRELLSWMGILVLPSADRAGGLVRLGRRELARGALLAIFPEGEPPTLARHAHDALAPFRPGAARLILGAGIPDLAIVPAALVAGPERAALRLPGEWVHRYDPQNSLYGTEYIELLAYDVVTVRFGRPFAFDLPAAPQTANGRAARITAHLEAAIGSLLRD